MGDAECVQRPESTDLDAARWDFLLGLKVHKWYLYFRVREERS